MRSFAWWQKTWFITFNVLLLVYHIILYLNLSNQRKRRLKINILFENILCDRKTNQISWLEASSDFQPRTRTHAHLMLHKCCYICFKHFHFFSECACDRLGYKHYRNCSVRPWESLSLLVLALAGARMYCLCAASREGAGQLELQWPSGVSLATRESPVHGASSARQPSICLARSYRPAERRWHGARKFCKDEATVLFWSSQLLFAPGLSWSQAPLLAFSWAFSCWFIVRNQNLAEKLLV